MDSDSVSQTPMKADVVIIGCGPVGAMLANLLGLQGISTLVLERAAEIYDLPRAVHFDDEVMRLLQTVELAQAMQGGGVLPPEAVNVDLDLTDMSITYIPKMPPVVTPAAKLKISGTTMSVDIPEGKIALPS